MADKNKSSSWLTVLILTGLGISVGPHQVLTRTAEVSRALSPVLSSYEVIRMAPVEIEQQVRTTGELRFRFKETDFYFNLEPHDMRAPNYRAVETGLGGVSRTLPPQPVHTFKGVLAGREDTRGRFNLTDGGVQGVVYAPEGWYYVEPLRNYLPSALAGELVIYSHADIKTDEDMKCGVSLAERLERGVDRLTAQVEASTSTTPTKYEFEIATEADYEYVQAIGSSEEATREIESILNQVEGVYQSELLLQLRISFQHVWATEDDPYTATNTSDLFDEFAEHWNTQFAAKRDYDVAHLWSGKDLDFAGIASQGTVCTERSESYSLSRRFPSPFHFLVPAHEIAHNFGASHPDEHSPPISVCDATLMQSVAHVSTGLTFCEFSRQEIASHLERNNSCLTTRPITLQPPTDLTATPVSSSGIDLTWKDNSTNETGFRVFRRDDRSAHWIEIGTTAANAATFVNRGLFPGDTYHYRVQAFNGSESSAFSNGAAATTREGPLNRAHWMIDTFAGGGIGDGGPAVDARVNRPEDVALDGAGNLYVADTRNNRIRRIDTEGIITTVAGTWDRGYTGDNGPAVSARLNHPASVAVDVEGNVYIADIANNRIRRIDASGTITTIAGSGEVGLYGQGYSGDGGPAVEAKLAYPSDVIVDGAGNLYVADKDNNRIRRIDTEGIITTIAGMGEPGYSGDNGPATEAQLNFPWSLAFDGAGNLYIADSGNHRVRRVDAEGTITTVAGTGTMGDPDLGGYSGDGGPATEAQLSWPRSLAFDGAGNLYIADTDNDRIRRMDASGTITTIAGTGGRRFSGDGGPAVDATVGRPQGMAVDSAGNLYIASRYNHRIRRVDTMGGITTVAGGGSGGDNGPAITAVLNYPHDVALDGAGNLYVAGRGSHRIRRVDSQGIITAIAGTGKPGYSGDNGPAVHARLRHPQSVAVDGSGNLYIADTGNHSIRRVDSRGIITTFAGTGEWGYGGDNGLAVNARLTYPSGVAVDGSGKVYIADSHNSRIRRVDSRGIITTFAGTGEWGYGGDNGLAVNARLNLPQSIALDSAGNVYIADSLNRRIRRVDAEGIITTIAVLPWEFDSVALGPSGDIYIAALDHRIRLLDPSGAITVIAGPRDPDEIFTGGFRGDGGPATEARVTGPSGMAVDSSGNLYIADSDNHRIRILTQASPPVTLQNPTGLVATTVSASRIDLSWHDNSSNETGFLVQRRQAGSADWVEIGSTSANVAAFSDVGLSAATTYRYRVQAFNNTQSSAFSNEAWAATPAALPPTVSGFAPTGGPVDTRVALVGTHFFEATAVEFNRVNAPKFEVVSGTRIRAFVPPGATSGPIRVVTPLGDAFSARNFIVTDGGIQTRLFVPIVMRSRGRTPGSFFTSELALTNQGSSTAAIQYTYTASFGGGSGTAEDSLGAGEQRVISDAIAYLTALGVPIGSHPAGGTLMVDFSNLSSPSDGAVTVRVATPVEEGRGRAGLAFPGLDPDGLLTGPAFITGLRQNRQDRSNVAIQNAGNNSQSSITLRVTVFSGDPASAVTSVVLPDLTLAPGGFHQYNGILTEAGFDNGYVKVERVEGTAPFYAYGVINDNGNSDGSFVFPVTAGSLAGAARQTLPVIVETGKFTSELTVTNLSEEVKTIDFSFVAEGLSTPDRAARFNLTIGAGQQRIIPDVIDAEMRLKGVEGVSSSKGGLAGALFARVENGDMSGIVVGARTGTPDGRGGQYGVFYPAVPGGAAFTTSVWVDGLQQDGENRANLALVNTGEVDSSASVFEIEIYDGDTGRLVSTITTQPLPDRRWRQINGLLANYGRGTTQGYVRVRKTSGNNPFLAYGVVNDGGAPGQRSGDGAYVPARE